VRELVQPLKERGSRVLAGARRRRRGLSSRLRSSMVRAPERSFLRLALCSQTDRASGVYRQRGEEMEGDRREPSVTEEGKLLAALSSPAASCCA
jgi:hypothetical protein